MPHILIVSLTDDPLDPPGADRYGGAQLFMFDFGRYLVRQGHELSYFTRRSRVDKPSHQKLGPRCQVFRFRAGPEGEISHHDLWRHESQLLDYLQQVLDTIEPPAATLTYNWLSGLIAIKAELSPLNHHILSLGRVRLKLQEEAHPSDVARDAGEVEVFKHADRLICVTQDEYMSLRQLYPEIDHRKVRIVPYGVDDELFRPRPDPKNHLRRKAERFKKGY